MSASSLAGLANGTETNVFDTNMASGMLRVDDPSGSASAGTSVVLDYATAAAPENWILKRQASGAYTLQSAAGGLYLDNTAGSNGIGSHPAQDSASGLTEQQWTISPAPNTDGIVLGQNYVLVNETGRVALSVPNAATATATFTPLDLETVTGGAGQVWRVNLIGNGVYTLTNQACGLNLDDPSGTSQSGTKAQL